MPTEINGQKTEEVKQPSLEQPQISIDTAGNMIMFIPLSKTNEIFARGMTDMARSQIVMWYANQARQAASLKDAVAKADSRSFVEKIMRRK